MHIDGRLKIGTICSGIGAPERALKNLGIDYELDYFCEIDKYAEKSYCEIHHSDTSKNLGDLTKVEIEKLPHDLDLLVGGTPCQDFSMAGLRKGGDAGSKTRSSLMWNFVSIIDQTKPKVVLWENVPGCVTDKMQKNYNKFIDTLRKIGYVTKSQFLNAKNFGIPQNRERVFVIALRKDLNINFNFPVGCDCGIRLRDMLESKPMDKYYLSNKQVEGLFNQSKSKNERGMGFQLTLQDGSATAKTVTTREANVINSNWILEPRCIELTTGQSQGYRVYSTNGISVTLAAEAGGMGAKTGLYLIPKDKFVDESVKKSVAVNFEKDADKILKTDKDIYRCKVDSAFQDNVVGVKMSPTLRAGNECTYVLDNYFVRKLTPREAFRLMGFSDEDFDLCGCSDSQLYKQAGNSIVVNVLMAIFGELYSIDWRPKVYGDWVKNCTNKQRRFLW